MPGFLQFPVPPFSAQFSSRPLRTSFPRFQYWPALDPFCALKNPWLSPLIPATNSVARPKEALMSTPGTFSSGVARELNFELLIMRIACALPFLYHGSAILFGAFGGPGPQNFAAFMHQPAVVGYLVGLAQLAGGLAILLGALLRIGTVCVMVV